MHALISTSLLVRHAKIRVEAAVAFAFMWVLATTTAVSAQEISRESREPNPYKPPVQSVWEFGIRITAQADMEKALVSFPVPIDWPEQSIAVQNIDASPQVLRRTEKDLDTAKLIVVNVGQLAAGEEAHVIIKMIIEKSDLAAPASPREFVFAKKTLGKMKVYLRSSPLIESSDKAIRKLAEELPIDSSAPAWDQIEIIYRWVRDNIKYRFEETNRSCLEALKSKEGDCGEMTGLFIALCRARGIPARAVWVPQHTYPEFYLEDADGNGHWFPCQLAGPYQFGEMIEPSPILQKGDNFRIPGLPRAHRYVQPTVAADGGPVQLQSIMRRVDKSAGDSDPGENGAVQRVEEGKR